MTISTVIQLIIKVAVDVLLSGILCPLNQLLFAEVINNLLTGYLIIISGDSCHAHSLSNGHALVCLLS